MILAVGLSRQLVLGTIVALKPTFLPVVENNSNLSEPYRQTLEQMKFLGVAVPQIMHLFASSRR